MHYRPIIYHGLPGGAYVRESLEICNPPRKSREVHGCLQIRDSDPERQAGFRNLLVLRSGPGEMLEGTVISVWDSLDHLRNSETTAFQEMLARVLALCEPRPSMREEEVLISEIASPDPDDTVTKF